MIETHALAETHALGQRLGRLLTPGTVVALDGELGAGKTALTQGIAAELGITVPITSPTFTLINRYGLTSGGELIHIDCYRLGEQATATAEAYAIGLDEILDEPTAIVVIEWAARVAALLPPDHLAIALAAGEGEATRRFVLSAHGPKSAQIVLSLNDTVPR